MEKIHIIGGGLAGCEAAWQLAQQGLPVVLHEMRKEDVHTAAHQTSALAELVCSNSFRSDDDTSNAVGLLHYELRHLNSLIMQAADANKVPAGSALAVDRHAFSAAVEHAITSHPCITVQREEIAAPDPAWKHVLIATGPLTSPALSEWIRTITGQEHLAFFDAIAPVVYKESINFEIAWFQSRYDKGDGKDYINCPLDKQQYYHFIETLLAAEKTEFKEWEKNTPYFEGCLPIEVMAERGIETLRFGCMKPVGLTNPHTGREAYAVVQLRQDNKLATLYNIVGFQTKLKYTAQKDVFRQIPALEAATFARLGGIHRNTFINSPLLLNEKLALKNNPSIRFAGQITGVEGYVESTAIGLLAGLFIAADYKGIDCKAPPQTTSMGALLGHITGNAEVDTFQPMNANFGLFEPLTGKIHKKERKETMTQRAKQDLQQWALLPEHAA